jgi:hypothetical protein
MKTISLLHGWSLISKKSTRIRKNLQKKKKEITAATLHLYPVGIRSGGLWSF